MIVQLIQEAEHYDHIAVFSDAKMVKGREKWTYYFEFNKMLKPGKVYKITVEEL